MGMTIEEIRAVRRLWPNLHDAAATWRSNWQDICNYVSPACGNFYSTSEPDKGEQKHALIYNSTPLRGSRTLSSGLHGGLTSPSRPWFLYSLMDEELADKRENRYWLQTVRDVTLRVFARSNFYTAVHSLYRELAGPGTACMLIEEDYDWGIRCIPLTIGEFYLQTNAANRVDTLVRLVNMTSVQMVGEFGMDRVSDPVRTDYKRQGTTRFNVVHVIAPRERRDLLMSTPENMPWFSVWYELDGKSDILLRESGYREQPFVAPRWEVVGADTYGRSLGWDALPDVKMLQKMEKDKMNALGLMIKPPLRADASLKGKALTIVPGGVNFVDPMSPHGFAPVYQVNPNFKDMAFEIERVEQRILGGFFVDLFLAILAEKKPMTATEVAERHDEKLLLLGPTLERLQGELLNPALDRTFNICARFGLFPEPPPDIAGMDLKVEYISLLAQAQKLVSLSALDQFGGFATALAQTMGSVLDKVDGDELVEAYGRTLGVPAKVLRAAKDVAAVRQARQQQEQVAATLDRAPGLAKGAKDVSTINASSSSMLNQILTGVTSSGSLAVAPLAN